jgi:hypothetical protein
MSYDPLLLVSTMPRWASSGSGMFSTPAETVWYQRSFGVASRSWRTRRGLFPLNATSESAAAVSPFSSAIPRTRSSGNRAATDSGDVENADHTTIFVTGSAYYGPS